MNAAEKRAQVEARRYTAFWPCLLVFGLLAVEHAIGLLGLKEQHQQLVQTRALQEQNMALLKNARQLSGELQSLSLDLLATSQTNAVARQIVQDFGISWTPGTNAAASAAPSPASGATQRE